MKETKEPRKRKQKRKPRSRWVLASDASCATCRALSAGVATATEGRLEVLPLTHPDVQLWREAALGHAAPWAPTLLRVDGDRTRAWTGGAMVPPLVRQLGVRATLRVLAALGTLRQRVNEPLAQPEGRKGVGRKQFLRLVTGAGVAGGLVLTGRTPAFAQQTRSAAETWAEANAARVPHDYDAVVSYAPEYRRALFVRFSPAVRSRLWSEHLRRYRAGLPELTPRQEDAFRVAAATVAKESTFSRAVDGDSARADRELRSLVADAFGREHAYAMLASLGPAAGPVPPQAPAAAVCTCSVESDYCANGTSCASDGCDKVTGCGTLYRYVCDGRCYN